MSRTPALPGLRRRKHPTRWDETAAVALAVADRRVGAFNVDPHRVQTIVEDTQARYGGPERVLLELDRRLAGVDGTRKHTQRMLDWARDTLARLDGGDRR